MRTKVGESIYNKRNAAQSIAMLSKSFKEMAIGLAKRDKDPSSILTQLDAASEMIEDLKAALSESSAQPNMRSFMDTLDEAVGEASYDGENGPSFRNATTLDVRANHELTSSIMWYDEEATEDEDEEYEIEVGIDILHYEPFVPANFGGHPDSWSDSEGGDIEIRVYAGDGVDITDNLTRETYDKLAEEAFKWAERN